MTSLTNDQYRKNSNFHYWKFSLFHDDMHVLQRNFSQIKKKMTRQIKMGLMEMSNGQWNLVNLPNFPHSKTLCSTVNGSHFYNVIPYVLWTGNDLIQLVNSKPLGWSLITYSTCVHSCSHIKHEWHSITQQDGGHGNILTSSSHNGRSMMQVQPRSDKNPHFRFVWSAISALY